MWFNELCSEHWSVPHAGFLGASDRAKIRALCENGNYGIRMPATRNVGLGERLCVPARPENGNL
jgi:hypothetical protein